MAKVGVFDSGVGGESVANAIKKALPDLEVVYVYDREHLPYGTKAPTEIKGYVMPILQDLVNQGCQIIVIACNTVTTTLIDDLRGALPIPLIGMEPMVKPAAEMTQTGIIAVCATPTTLASPRYKWLKETYAADKTVLEPDCSDWTKLIEDHEIDRIHVHEQIESVCQAGADIIVLGCTHYHWIEDIIAQEAAGRATIVQPEQPVIEQLKRVLELQS
jgi:glutamate racemase